MYSEVEGGGRKVEGQVYCFHASTKENKVKKKTAKCCFLQSNSCYYLQFVIEMKQETVDFKREEGITYLSLRRLTSRLKSSSSNSESLSLLK